MVLGTAATLARDGISGWWVVLPVGFSPFVALYVFGGRRAAPPFERERAVPVDEEEETSAPLSGGPTPELTAREAEVLVLLAEGLTNREIAQKLYVSAATVKSHVNAICRKLQATNRTHAVATARQRGLLLG